MKKDIPEELIKKSLIYETVQLFATMAMADGKLTIEEAEYIKKYYHTLYPDDFANFLIKEFNLAVKEKINEDEVIEKLILKLSHNDRIILIFKLIELMAADEIDETERTLLDKIALKFNITTKDIDFFINVISVSSSDKLKLDEEFNHRYLVISDNIQTGDVFVKHDKLDLIIINIGKILIMLQKDDNNNISIAGKKISSHFTIPVYGDSQIIINNSYELSKHDLQYYFRQLKTKNHTFFINKKEHDYILNDIQNENAILKLETKKCNCFLTPIIRQGIYVNNVELKKESFVDINADVYYKGERINIKTLLTQNNFRIGLEKRLSENEFINIGNNYEHDIYIDDNIEKSWSSIIEYKENDFYFDIKNCPFPVYVNNNLIKDKIKLTSNDKIQIYKFIISYNKKTQTFEKRKNSFNSIYADNVFYKFADNNVAIDNVSFKANRGELVGIMGSSGCGKTTLLNMMSGFYKPDKGNIKADKYDIFKDQNLIREYLSYVPQDDLLYENLTVFENLYYNAKLRYPGKDKDIKKLVNDVLRDIGLYEKKDVKVGDPLNKVLSGGERKRVNIGLELLSDSDILLLDEPTSGLSSKDSENIIKILRSLAYKGKIIFLVIHQPSSLIYQMLNKILILDRGGKLAYFGEVNGAYKYFETFSDNIQNEISQIKSPDFILDTLEQPIRDIDGKALPIRRYSPAFWKEKFIEYQKENFKEISEGSGSNKEIVKKTKNKLKDRFAISVTLLQRNFINKLRDKTNIVITFLLPPLLGLGVGAILRYAPNEDYNFFSNQHVPTFLFLFVLIAVFLGITNSIEEIIKDQKIILREKMLNISKLNFYNSKIITLIPFAVIQNILFFTLGYLFIEGREFYFQFILFGTLVSITGIAIGLFISSIPGLSSKAAINIIPLILIPQIVFGGGLIKFQEMNQQLVTFENSPIPEVCQLMPSRWGFEAILVYQAEHNRYHPAIDNIISEEDSCRITLYDVKMEQEASQDSSVEIQNKIIELQNKSDSLEIVHEELDALYMDKYGNSTVQAACDIDANQGCKNFIDGKTSVFPMFIDTKTLPFIKTKVSTPIYNTFILLSIIILMSISTIVILRIRFK